MLRQVPDQLRIWGHGSEAWGFGLDRVCLTANGAREKMRTCKTTVVIRGRKGDFCPGMAGRIWDKSDAEEKRLGLT